MIDINNLNFLNRSKSLFENSLIEHDYAIKKNICNSKFLIIGAGGSIGSSVSKLIFSYSPKELVLVDINENSLVECVRNLRSSNLNYITTLKTHVLDIGSDYFQEFLINKSDYFDYVANFSALKHVRSESNIFTLLRMIDTNMIYTQRILEILSNSKIKNFFCVSTDKATSPINFMGASKRGMELILNANKNYLNISTARFANVAFSDGSLLYGLLNRISKSQPISIPLDIKRYFITHEESGILCLFSMIFGKNCEIFFPNLKSDIIYLTSFTDIINNVLNNFGYEIYKCESEAESISEAKNLISKNKWPCYFFESDTTGEKEEEIFYDTNDVIRKSDIENLSIIESSYKVDDTKLNTFFEKYKLFKASKHKDKIKLLKIFKNLLPDFNHKETFKYLDDKM